MTSRKILKAGKAVLEEPLVKRLFKGSTLEGFVEAAKCKTLEELI